MSYSEPLSHQISLFLSSVGFGFAVGIYYAVVRGVFCAVSEKNAAIISGDLFFGISSCVAAFFFMVLYCDGRVRFHLATGILFGCTVFYLTVGKYIFKVIYSVVTLLKKTVGMLLSPFKIVGVVFISGVKRQCKKLLKHIKKPKKSKEKLSKEKKSEKKSFFYKIIAKTHLKNKSKSV